MRGTALSGRLAIAIHEIVVDALIGDIEHHIGQRRKLARNLRQCGKIEHVAQHDAQDLTPTETGKLHRRWHAGCQRCDQARSQLIPGNGRVEITRAEEFVGPLRMRQDRLGKKPAVLKYGGEVTLARGHSGQTLIGRAVLIPQTRQIVRYLRFSQTASSSSVIVSPGRSVPGWITDA